MTIRDPTRQSVHSTQINQGWVREEELGPHGSEGERLVKIQFQDATTSTKHVGFRIDKSIQTSETDTLSAAEQECSCGSHLEIGELREELKKTTKALEKAMEAANSEVKTQFDFASESPLNLFIQCFKQKYGLSVNPNDVAIFV